MSHRHKTPIETRALPPGCRRRRGPSWAQIGDACELLVLAWGSSRRHSKPSNLPFTRMPRSAVSPVTRFTAIEQGIESGPVYEASAERFEALTASAAPWSRSGTRPRGVAQSVWYGSLQPFSATLAALSRRERRAYTLWKWLEDSLRLDRRTAERGENVDLTISGQLDRALMVPDMTVTLDRLPLNVANNVFSQNSTEETL